MITYIYLLEFKDSTFYIGKTNNIKRRIKEHTLKYNTNFDYIVLEEIDNKEWKFWESYWIEQFQAWGFILKNKNKGGGGTLPLIGRSEETKRKISRSLKGRKFSKETRKKISKSKTGIKPNRTKPMPKRIIDTLPKEDIIREYTINNKSAKDISLLYNVAPVTIINLLKQNKIKRTKNKIDDNLKHQIIEEYNKHYDISKTAINFNLSKITILNHLKQWGEFQDQRYKHNLYFNK